MSRVYLRWNRLLPTGYGRLLGACEGSDFLEWPGCFGVRLSMTGRVLTSLPRIVEAIRLAPLSEHPSRGTVGAPP